MADGKTTYPAQGLGGAHAQGRARARPRTSRALRDHLGDRDRSPLRSRESGKFRLSASSSAIPDSIPFTRGVQPTMYRGRLWTMRQYAGFGTAEESNRRYRYLLRAGPDRIVGGVRPADPDGPRRRPSAGARRSRPGGRRDRLAGRYGRPCSGGLPLDKISTSMTINATASILLALYLVVAEQQGVGWNKLNGTIQNDILKEYVARGTYIYPPRPVDADHHRHLRLRDARSAELEHDFDLRLPHPRGRLDRGSGAGVHAGRRHRLRRSGDRRPGWTSTRSPAGSRSSSTSTTTSSKRSPSIARRAGCGRES